MAIEQPVRRCRQSDAILDGVGTAIGHGDNMCRLGFGAATAIDYPKSSYSACIVVGVENCSSERSVADEPARQHPFCPPLERRTVEKLGNDGIVEPRVEVEAPPIAGVEGLGQSSVHDLRKVRTGQ